MNLIELFDALPINVEGSGRFYNAVRVPNYGNFRVAVDHEGNSVLLLTIHTPIKNLALKNSRLKYLRLEQNINCNILEENQRTSEVFTVITFTSVDRNLQDYFLRIAESLIKTLGESFTQQKLIDSLNKFVEIFRALSDPPTKTVQGLWSELLLIENAKNSSEILRFWHSVPEEKFDFNSGDERIEVKSSSGFDRIHTFSSEQLNPKKNIQVLIASIFLRQSINGLSIRDLTNRISNKIDNDLELQNKLDELIIKTLGSSVEHTTEIKFDYNIAKESVKFYWQTEVARIKEEDIPSEVSEVRYKSDLSNLIPVNISKIENKRRLFSAI